MVFCRIPRDKKLLQVSRTFPSILGDVYNAVVKMISIRYSISNASSFLSMLFDTVPCVPITNSITVTLMFHSFFSFPCKVQVFFSDLFFFDFHYLDLLDSKVSSMASSNVFIKYRQVLHPGRDLYYYYYCYYFTFLRIFHTRISGWFITGLWAIASHLKTSRISSSLQGFSQYSGRS